MSYVSLNQKEKERLFEKLGITNTGDLFKTIPERFLLERDLKIPGPYDEQTIESMLSSNPSRVVFAGGGIYRHYIPAVVDTIASRQEFYTSYTPYQPEISQGTLQVIFEYQSMMTRLMHMDVSNASMYDGATALAEACLMAIRAKKVKRILLSKSINPAYRSVARTYLRSIDGLEVEEVPFDSITGQVDLDVLKKATMANKRSAFFIQSPNYFGIIEPMDEVAFIMQDAAFWGIVVTEAISLGIMRPPGDYGPDVVVGDAQSFGNPPSAGGPLLGFFCTKREYIRSMPGRLVGLTRDKDGRQAFCLTLATREQHIRREKATSNICSNQGLCVLRAAVYLSAVGPRGLRTIAEQCASGARYLLALLGKRGIRTVFTGPVFNEFVLRIDDGSRERASQAGIVPGIRIDEYYPELTDSQLITVTEMNSERDCKWLLDIM